MLFNSIEFAVFLPIVFLLYWFVTQKSLRLQNILLLGTSYVFYAWWDWRFLSLIIFSSFIDYCVGIKLAKSEDRYHRKVLLLLSILVNIGFLGLFKYFNFFSESFADAFTLLGRHIEPSRLNLVLPVGISFYTFQTLSYSIDVYRRKLEPTKDIISFFAFVSFFPQLVAGPIERATNLLPQFLRKRTFDYTKAVDGMRQILWGLFKKVVIADNAATYANEVFNNYEDYSGSTLFVGAVFFTFQIYGDFSGYSDIAIGSSRLFGFNLKQNFAFPYFSRDIAEFWRRWHISLSSWFRDYVYIPLGGSRGGNWSKIRNTFIIFSVSGLWHGANWTFLAWGFLNTLYFLPLLLLKKNRKHTDVVAEEKIMPSLKEFIQITGTFFITVIAWVFFRSENISTAFGILKRIFSYTSLSIPMLPKGVYIFEFTINIFFIVLLIVAEWVQRTKKHGLELRFKNSCINWSVYTLLIMIIILFEGNSQEFIYFQF